MVTAINDDDTILESIQAGADGYLTKDRAVAEVASAVRAAHAGETLLPRSVIMRIAQWVAEARPFGPPTQDRRHSFDPASRAHYAGSSRVSGHQIVDRCTANCSSTREAIGVSDADRSASLAESLAGTFCRRSRIGSWRQRLQPLANVALVAAGDRGP
jgi:hypothetical protein